MFWGCVLKENKPFEIKTGSNRIIHLSEACLNPKAGEGKVYLQLSSGGDKYNLCVLQKDKWESYKLDHFLSLFSDSTHPYKLSITGGGSATEVHVTGYIETEEGEEEGLKVEKIEKPVEKVEKKKQEEVKLKDEKPKAKEAKPVERKDSKEQQAPKSLVSVKKEEKKAEIEKPAEDLEEEEEDEEEGLDDEDEEDEDESGEDIIDVEDSDDEEEMEKLLNRTKKEEAKPVKLRKLDDGSKIPTQTANLNGNKNIQHKPNTPNKKNPQNQQNKQGQQGSGNKQHFQQGNKQHSNQGSGNKQNFNKGKPQHFQGNK